MPVTYPRGAAEAAWNVRAICQSSRTRTFAPLLLGSASQVPFIRPQPASAGRAFRAPDNELANSRAFCRRDGHSATNLTPEASGTADGKSRVNGDGANCLALRESPAAATIPAWEMNRKGP